MFLMKFICVDIRSKIWNECQKPVEVIMYHVYINMTIVPERNHHCTGFVLFTRLLFSRGKSKTIICNMYTNVVILVNESVHIQIVYL